MTTSAEMPHSLTRLPIEILLEIYHQLDMDGVYNLSAAHRTFHDLFVRRKAYILLPVMSRQFSPFDELLQVYTATAADIEPPKSLYVPRKVIFKRFVGDEGLVLAPRPAYLSMVKQRPTNGFMGINTNSMQRPSPHASPYQTVILTEHDLKPVLAYCRLAWKWQERFPQMRWIYEPENCRHLRAHEAERCRRALYRWWLYGYYFHGDLPRPRIGLPEPGVDDIRISQLRHYSTAELLELMDMVEATKDLVLHYIYPRLHSGLEHEYDGIDAMDVRDRSDSFLRGWKDQTRCGRIIKTYCKLGPKALMYLFDNIYNFPRKRLISEATTLQPNLTFDQESIQVSIRCALDERNWLEKKPALPIDGAGGIIDWDNDHDVERLELVGDARLDGTLPDGVLRWRSFSHYSPRGDDGSHLDDLSQSGWTEGLQMVSYA